MPHHLKPQRFVKIQNAEENADGEKFINKLIAAKPAQSYKEQLQWQRQASVVCVLSTQSWYSISIQYYIFQETLYALVCKHLDSILSLDRQDNMLTYFKDGLPKDWWDMHAWLTEFPYWR
jgi:hypothetical protein